MDWLYQNWIWIALAVGGYFLVSRTGMNMGMGGCCGGGHSHDHDHGRANGEQGGGGGTLDARAASAVGQETGTAGAPNKRSHQGHGCC